MKTIAIIFAVCIISAHSSVLEEQQRQQLALIRGVCVAQSGLNPLEIRNIAKAVRPVAKLAEASRCIIQNLIELRETNEVVNEIVNRTKISIRNNLPRIIDDVIDNCDRLLGPESCDKVLQLINLIVEEAKRRRNPLLREA